MRVAQNDVLDVSDVVARLTDCFRQFLCRIGVHSTKHVRGWPPELGVVLRRSIAFAGARFVQDEAFFRVFDKNLPGITLEA
jgi:hypothetical protein